MSIRKLWIVGVVVVDLITYMKHERTGKMRGVYWLFQVNLAFNSNKMEGSQLSEDQTEHLFNEKRIFTENGESISLDDINEMTNHFRAFDYCIDNVNASLNEKMIKNLHLILKRNTSDERNPLTPIGAFKTRVNVIGNLNPIKATHPDLVESEISELLKEYSGLEKVVLEDIVDFHYKFEKIHPFADGNGRVGRLIVVKECLKNNIIPPIILDKHRNYYTTGLKEYGSGAKERLSETFRAGQDHFEQVLERMEFTGVINNSVENINGKTGQDR